MLANVLMLVRVTPVFNEPLYLSECGHQNLAILLHETCVKGTFQVFLECIFIKLENYHLLQVKK